MYEEYRELANAIIERAALDYREALKSGKETFRLKNLRIFFRSEYFKTLTEVDGESLMKKIEEAVS